MSAALPELPNPKLLSLTVAVGLRVRMRAAGKRVVLMNGDFDLLHTGHLYCLQKARARGDALFVALNSDARIKPHKGLQRPVLDEVQRAYALGALACVDAVVIAHETSLSGQINAIAPDVYACAGEHPSETLDPDARAALEKVGAKIECVPLLAGFSTASLIAKIKATGGA